MQNLYNLADRSAEDVLEYCERNGIAFIPWFPIATGKLARPGGPLDAIAHRARRDARAARARLAAAPLPGDAADPRHVARSRTWRRTWPRRDVQLTDDEFEALSKAS